jgi:hypothetical protein
METLCISQETTFLVLKKEKMYQHYFDKIQTNFENGKWINITGIAFV